jgi:hypothetical protein
MVVMTSGMLLVNAIAPIRPADLSSGAQSYSDSPTYSLAGARNSAQPFGSVPVVLGKHLVYPPYGANPYTEILGNDEYLRMLFVWGYGPLKIEDIKIGDTPIANYSDYEIETREGRVTDAPLTLIPSVVHQDSIGVELTQVGGGVTRSARAGADELSVDIVFPQGLAYFDGNGNRTTFTVSISVAYREIGTSPWTSETVDYADTTSSALRFGKRWTVDRTKQYEVSLTRITADTTDSRTVDTVYWSVLRSTTNDHPVSFPFPLAMTAVRIRASEQLQGTVDNFNAIVTSYAPVWNGTEWAGEEPTQNPAALFRLCLKHPANAKRQ